MRLQGKKRIIAVNAFLFAALFIMVSFNKEVLRPAFNHIPFLRSLLGCIPNFLAAYLISMAFINALVIRQPKFSRLLAYAASMVVFGILTLEELKPMWGASTVNDSLDIAASLAGSLLAMITYEIIAIIQKKRKKVKNET
jgi:hypothetical protein